MAIAIGLIALTATLLGCVLFAERLTRTVARAWYAEKQAYLTAMVQMGSGSHNKFE